MRPRDPLFTSLLLALACAACGRDSSSDPATAAETDVAVAIDAAVAPDAGPATTAAPPDDDEPSVPSDLPPFRPTRGANTGLAEALVEMIGRDVTGPRDYGDLPGGWRHGGAADVPEALIDALDHGDPLTVALAAVEADPGLPQARVLLASLVEDEAFRVAQLTPLVDAPASECPDCVDELLNIEWADDSPAVTALLARVKPSRARRNTMAFQAAWAAYDLAPVKSMFASPRVSLRVECSNCDEPTPRESISGARLRARLEREKAEDERYGVDRVANHELRCRKDCCATYTSMLGHSSTYFLSMCFAPGTDRIVSLDLVAG